MLISEEQREANRRNARRSTSPTTPDGKKAASLNAVTYGLRTRSLIIRGEYVADYWRLWDGLEAEWQPETDTERLYVEQMSVSQWMLARMAPANNVSGRKACHSRPSSISWTASPGTPYAWKNLSPPPCTN
jgi:hypothetical protein